MITNEVYFFKNQSSVSTSDSLYNVNDGTLILQVDGNVSNLELLVLGNTDLIDDDFVTLKTINATDYSMSDKITSTGIYWIDINGIRKIKLNLSKITGSVNVKALTKRGLTTDLVARAMAANASGGGSYTLPVASADTLGGIKIGENLTIDENGVVSASGGGDSDSIPIFRLYISSQMATYMFGVGITLSPNEKSQLQNILDKKLDNYLIEVNFYNSSLQKSTFLFQLYGKHRDKIVFNTVETIYFNNTPTLCDIRLTINGEFTDETNTCSSAVLKYYNTLYQIPLKTDVLVKENTTSYTPTSDYNPATKKYVDDSISSAITTSLEGSY